MTAAAAPAVPAVRDLRRALRRTRRTHSNRTLGELLTDVYLVAFVAVLYGGAGAYSLRRHLARPLPAPVGTEDERAWLLVALLVVIAALAWRGLRLLGPVVSTPAVQAWVLASPVDRRAWLNTPLWWLVGLTGFGGAVVGAAAGWAGLSGQFAFTALAGAGAGIGLAALAVLAQASGRVPGRFSRADIGLVAAVAVAGATLGGVRLAIPDVPPIALAVLAVVVAVVTVRAARPALSRIDRSTLVGGAEVVGAASSAMVMLDPSLLSGVVAQRRWRRMGRVHSARWLPGSPSWVLLQADLRRQWRRRSDLFVWAAMILVPYATAVFAPPAVGSVRIVAGFIAVERLASGLRTVCRSPALRRALGGTDASLRLIHLVVPAVGLAVWWSATVPAGAAPASYLVTTLLTAGLLGAVYRTATRKPMSYDGGLADSPFGLIPVNLLRQSLRGPDVVALLVLIALFLH